MVKFSVCSTEILLTAGTSMSSGCSLMILTDILIELEKRSCWLGDIGLCVSWVAISILLAVTMGVSFEVLCMEILLGLPRIISEELRFKLNKVSRLVCLGTYSRRVESDPSINMRELVWCARIR